MATNQAVLWEEVWNRTSNSKHFHLVDGSKQAVIFSSAVHYEDENGCYQNIDTALYDEADMDDGDFLVTKHGIENFKAAREKSKADKKVNKLNRDNFDFQALRVPFAAKIPRNWKRGYTIGRGSDKLAFKPVGASPSKGYVDEQANNEITYQDAWNDTDVKLEVTEKGIKEYIVLKTAMAPSAFTFEVIGALSESLTSGELILQPAWLEDATGIKRDVQQVVRVVAGIKYLDLVADVTGLAYPVTIDPTLTLTPDETASKDTYISSASPDVNYATSGAIYASDVFRSLLQFDVSSIPTGSSVTSAQVTLGPSGISGTANSVEFHTVTSSWVEGTATWNNQPAFSATVDDTQAYANPHVFDLLSFYQAVVAGTQTNYGHLIKRADEGVVGEYTYKSSSYAGSPRPTLVLIYNEVPSAPVVTVPNGAETWNAEHTVTWTGSIDQLGTEYASITNDASVNSQSVLAGNKSGQTFIKVDDNNILAVTLSASLGTASNVTLKITGVVDGLPDESIVYSTQTIALNTSYTPTKFTLATPVTVPQGTLLAIVLDNTSAYTMTVRYSASDNYAGGARCTYTSPSWAQSTLDIYFIVHSNEQRFASQIQYQIQLSTDNGANYHDIAAMTTAGAASYDYDFTPETASPTCLIRIRAYDGVGYSLWDVSDGIFTIQHNQAPAAPTLLDPSSGVIDRALIDRLSWQHNDPNVDPQAQFDLMYSVNNGANWTTITQVTINQYWDAPANTFSHGNVLWKVRTYDQAGLSGPYSAQATFLAGDKPANPTITSPSGTITDPKPTIQWSSVGQTGVQVQVGEWDSGTVTTTNKALTCGITLTNNTTYTVKLRILNADFLWSDWVTSEIATSYTPPATPTITANAGDGYIEIAITNPTPTGTQPIVKYNDIYRRGNKPLWSRIATNIVSSDSFKDYATASGQVYEYKIVTVGENGTISESLTASGSIKLGSVWIHDVADPAGTIHQFKTDEGRSQSWKPSATMMLFAGRKGPVAEFGDQEEMQVSVNLTISKQTDDMAALESLVYRKPTVCFRDSRGRKLFGIIPQLEPADTWYGNTVTLNVVEIDYKEEV